MHLRDDPPSHENCGCIEGWMPTTDAKGHTRMAPCARWLAWAKWQREQGEADKQRELAETRVGRNSAGFNFLSMFGVAPSPLPAVFERPQLPAGPRTIEADEWVPVIHGTTVFGAYMFDVFWMAIEAQFGVPRRQIHPDLVRRVNGFLGTRGIVATAGLEKFEAALAAAIRDRKERHPCGVRTGAGLLDVMGKAIQDLGCDIGVETDNIGHADGRGCPMAVYAAA